MNISGVVSDCGPCPYLAGRTFTAFHTVPAALPEGIGYRELLDAGFRRNGGVLYAPQCAGCAECLPLRLAVAGFQPRRDQRRVWRRNADLVVSWADRGGDEERDDLYRRYERAVHGRVTDAVSDAMAEGGGIPGGELHARDGDGRLLAVSLCDVVGDAWSSVYCYYDPAQRERSLGTYMAMAEIRAAAALALRWWYPGFLVADCAKMAYKSRFGPNQILVGGRWVDHRG